MALHSMECITILTSNPWTQDVFPFVYNFFDFFQWGLAVLNKIFMILDIFILKYFIVSDAIMSGIVLFTSFPDVLPLVSRSAIDFSVLILYPATSLNSLIKFNSHLAEI